MLLTILHEVYWLFLPQVPCDTLGLMGYLFSDLKEKKKGGKEELENKEGGKKQGPTKTEKGLLPYLSQGRIFGGL